MDWPENPIAVAAIRSVLRGRARRAEEAADAFARAVAPTPAEWHARVLRAIGELRDGYSRASAEALVREWDRRPVGVPPAAVVLSPWVDPDAARQPGIVVDRSELPPGPAQAAYDLASRWFSVGGRDREWRAAANALLRWAAAQRRDGPQPDRAVPQRSVGLSPWVLLGFLFLVSSWRRR